MTSKTVKKLGEYFVGEICVFYLKDMHVPIPGEGGEPMQISAMTEGYVVDVDETYYYLGSDDGTVDKVITHNVIAMVEIAEMGSYDIDDFDFTPPESQEDVH